MLWRRGLLDDFSDLAAAFPAALDGPGVGSFIAGGAAAPSTADKLDSPATESPCPTADIAFSLSLGRVLVEPME